MREEIINKNKWDGVKVIYETTMDDFHSTSSLMFIETSKNFRYLLQRSGKKLITRVNHDLCV